jgi:uncharacterized protein
MSGLPMRPVPVVDDRDTGPFWSAALNGSIAICVCNQCGEALHLPKAYCHHCGSWDINWRQVAGKGKLYSWTVVRLQVHPAFPVPYAIVVVDLDEAPGVRLLGYLDGDPHLTAGQPMQAYMENIADVTLPNWKPN